VAHPVDFIGTNVIMKAPRGQEETVRDVSAFRNEQCCITCWQLTEDELAEVNRTGRIFLSVHYGGGMPPVFIGGEDAVREISADYGGTFPKQEAADAA
jgi:hypothetical protein